MLSFFIVLGAGLFGVVGHWCTRYAQDRTQSTFPEYLLFHKASTISALFSILASSSVIYQTIPTGSSGRDFFMFLVSSYTSGYMLDSTLNRDKPVSTD